MPLNPKQTNKQMQFWVSPLLDVVREIRFVTYTVDGYVLGVSHAIACCTNVILQFVNDSRISCYSAVMLTQVHLKKMVVKTERERERERAKSIVAITDTKLCIHCNKFTQSLFT